VVLTVKPVAILDTGWGMRADENILVAMVASHPHKTILSTLIHDTGLGDDMIETQTQRLVAEMGGFLPRRNPTTCGPNNHLLKYGKLICTPAGHLNITMSFCGLQFCKQTPPRRHRLTSIFFNYRRRGLRMTHTVISHDVPSGILFQAGRFHSDFKQIEITR
jgi:hypothetical protein